MEACKIYQAKEADLYEIESSIDVDQLKTMKEESEKRGNEQYGAQMAKGIAWVDWFRRHGILT